MKETRNLGKNSENTIDIIDINIVSNKGNNFNKEGTAN